MSQPAALAVRPVRGGGGRGLGGGRFRTWPEPAALFQARDLRLAEEPELAAPLSRHLPGLRELAQPLVADLQLLGSNQQQDQAVLPHGGDSTAYPNSLAHDC